MTTKILGDPHLGRVFRTNVPLHRRGEREGMIRRQFVEALNPDGAELHICLGDLFDSPNVGLDTIMFAANAYLRAAARYPRTQFIVLRGNHDKGRDLEAVTAFDVFAALVRDRVTVVEQWHQQGEHVFFGWSPDRSAEEVVSNAGFQGATIAYGHWDVDLRSGGHNLIPTHLLAERGIKVAYTGHVHLTDRFARNGVDVIVHGSMTGFAHGEGHPYVTLTPGELATTDVTDLCVRVRLGPGETIDAIPDCLQWQVEQAKGSDEPDLDVTMEGFDLARVYAEAFADLPILPLVKEQIDRKWQQTFTKLG